MVSSAGERELFPAFLYVYVDDADTLLRGGTGQPLFQVEHLVGGTEPRPLNRWRIVHLTDAPGRLIEGFEDMAASPCRAH
jgi:hypothetical protein